MVQLHCYQYQFTALNAFIEEISGEANTYNIQVIKQKEDKINYLDNVKRNKYISKGDFARLTDVLSFTDANVGYVSSSPFTWRTETLSKDPCVTLVMY